MQKKKEKDVKRKKEKNDKAKNLKWAMLSDFAAADAMSAYPVSTSAGPQYKSHTKGRSGRHDVTGSEVLFYNITVKSDCRPVH